MKKLVSFMLFVIGISSYANINAVVSILPEKTFVEAIGGEKVNVSLMVKPGNSPHSYEPKASQMRDISKADIYFAIGVEFEEAWLPKFADQNKKMKLVNISKGIEKIKIQEHSHGEHEDEHHDKDHKEHGDEKDHDEHKHDEHDKKHAHHDHDEDHDEHEHHHHEGLDPHVWTSPANVKIIAKNIYKYLVKLDKQNEKYYKSNYENFLAKINKTDKEIKKILINVETKTKFMVFHPAWGYFANDYGLEQIAIEAGGKNPKPKQVMHLIEEAKEENVKAVFTSPEFSEKVAKQIAKEVGVPVVKMSPLNPKWSENLINLAKSLAK